MKIVGRTFLVLASLRFLLDLLGWAVWKLGEAGPVVAFFLPRGGRGLPVDSLIEAFPTVLAVQATVAACVAWISFTFLRLRPWARPALELVAWVALAVITVVAGALVFEWTRLPTGPDARGLAASVVALLGLDVLLGAAIRTMRSAGVRSAFRGERPGSR